MTLHAPGPAGSAGSPARAAPAALARLLQDAQADLADYATLAGLLEQQLEGALRHDGTALEGLAQRILALVEQLDGRRRVRMALVGRLVGDTTPAGMETLMARLPAAQRGTIAALWARLEAAVHDCKARNGRNARLITEQQALFERVLHGTQEPLYADA